MFTSWQRWCFNDTDMGNICSGTQDASVYSVYSEKNVPNCQFSTKFQLLILSLSNSNEFFIVRLFWNLCHVQIQGKLDLKEKFGFSLKKSENRNLKLFNFSRITMMEFYATDVYRNRIQLTATEFFRAADLICSA